MLITETGRRSFDHAAADYDAVRPGYPPALIADLLTLSHASPQSRVLEVACGTGQLTRQLGAKGLNVLAIDIGAQLLALAEQRCAAWPNVAFRQIAYEALDDAAGFDIIACATAFHWLDPATRFGHAATLLKPGGTLAIIQNVNKFGQDTGGLRQEIDAVYRRVVPADLLEAYQSHEARTEGLLEDFIACDLFGAVETRRYPFVHSLSAGDYLRLLNSFSYQHNLPQLIKDKLFADLHGVITNAGGKIDLIYEATLFLAKCVKSVDTV